jgi:hypothetical protein
MSAVGTATATQRLRGVLEREAATRLGLKRAKAARFLAHLEAGVKTTEAWQLLAVDPELQALEEVHEAARVDLIVENAVNWGKLDRRESEDAEP